MNFDEFDFSPDILKGVESAGFSECMPIQSQAYQAIFQGKDVLGQSQTGTGKTAAFLLSAFHLLLNEKKGTKVLVIAPTRELAVQIKKDADVLGQYLPFRSACFYGGVGYGEQRKALSDNYEIMIGTPGRLIDLASSGDLEFQEVGILIVDEADRLFDMGFLPDLRRMLKAMLKPEERRTMLFSATINSRVEQIAWEYMTTPEVIKIDAEQVTVEKIAQELYHVGKQEKFSLLLGILTKLKPQNAVIFTNTKHEAVRLVKRLRYNGHHADYLIGDLPQSQRLNTIDQMKKGKIPILVATDVAARGLHIEDLQLVVNYDIPEDAENYVHRIGRTARAGNEGRAISLACERFVYGLPQVEEYIGMKIPVSWASEDMFVEEKVDKTRTHRTENKNRLRSRSGEGSGSRTRTGTGDSRPRTTGAGESRPRTTGAGESRPRTTGAGESRPRMGSGENRPRTYSKDSRRKGSGQANKHKKSILDENGRRLKSQIDNLTKADFSASGEKKQEVNSARKQRSRKPGNRNKNSVLQKREAAPRSSVKRPDANASVEERLAYYRSKYGEDFVLQEGSSSATSKKTKSGKGKKKGKGGNSPQSKPKENKAVSREGQPKNTTKQKTQKKKGLIARIFGKK